MNTFYRWLAYKLPKKLVYWCAIRLWVNGTGDKYLTTHASRVRVITVLKRWEKDIAK